jgi:integrase
MARRRGQRTGYVYRRGNSWLGQFRVDTAELDEQGKFKRKTLTKFIAPASGPGKVLKKRAQQLFYEEYLKDLHKSGPLSTRTVAEFVGEIFRPQVVLRCKPTGKSHYEGMLKNHVLPALGEFMLRDVRPQHVYNLVQAKLDAGLSIQTVVHVRNVISAIFRHAKRMQAYSGDLPTEGVKLPALVHKERGSLTWTQVQAVAAHLPEQLASLVIVLALTGLRIGEAMGLRWKHVDLEAGMLYVRENFVRGEYGTLKTARSRRDVPLHSLAIAALSRLTRGDAESPVFAGAKSGKPLDQHNIAKRFLKEAGRLAGCPWVSWHCLRHTYASLADQVGMSIAERQRVMGHASAGMNLHYTHADLDLVRERMEKIGKVN